MITPGSNLLQMALRMMGKANVMYFKDIGRTTDATGRDVTSFAVGVMIDTGQVQAVPRGKYQFLGLDFTKNYVTWYVPALDVRDVTRGNSGDEFEFNGRRYRVESDNDWLAIDGWIGALAIDIGAAHA